MNWMKRWWIAECREEPIHYGWVIRWAVLLLIFLAVAIPGAWIEFTTGQPVYMTTNKYIPAWMRDK